MFAFLSSLALFPDKGPGESPQDGGSGDEGPGDTPPSHNDDDKPSHSEHLHQENDELIAPLGFSSGSMGGIIGPEGDMTTSLPPLRLKPPTPEGRGSLDICRGAWECAVEPRRCWNCATQNIGCLPVPLGTLASFWP